jgi:hypothetical protein
MLLFMLKKNQGLVLSNRKTAEKVIFHSSVGLIIGRHKIPISRDNFNKTR